MVRYLSLYWSTSFGVSDIRFSKQNEKCHMLEISVTKEKTSNDGADINLHHNMLRVLEQIQRK